MIDPAHLTAFVASKLCHDLVSPVSSANSALELLDEPGGEEMREQAESLLKQSLSAAAAKLEFLRYAFGSQGLNSGAADLHEAKSITEKYVATGKSTIEWDIQTGHFGYSHARLMMNLVLIGIDCLPWGGVLGVSIRNVDDTMTITVDAKGDRTRLKLELENGLNAEEPEEGWTGRTIQPVFAQMMVRELGSPGIDATKVTDEHIRVQVQGVRSAG